MDKFTIILNSIDWIFASIILIGGRYFGSKYIRLSKSDSLNFLGFATMFAIIYLVIIYFTSGIAKNDIANLFITYLMVTSFYELIAQRIFEMIENLPLFGKKKDTPLPEAVAKYEAQPVKKLILMELILKKIYETHKIFIAYCTAIQLLHGQKSNGPSK